MVLNKRGMFFTIIVIYLLALFLVSYGIYSMVYERKAITKRVETMDNFLFSLEQNLERDVYAFGFRAIFLAEEHITSTGEYFSDLDNFVQEAFFDGTINTESSDILIGVNYNDLVDSINQRAGRINVDVNLSYPEISMTQEDPWHVAVIVSFNLSLTDKANLSSWHKHKEIKSFIEVQGFEDPVYLISTNGKVTNKINITLYEVFASGGDVSNLSLHVENSYYKASVTAPSFLNRLAGNLSADVNGIESLVYLPELSAQGISTKSKSCVDYIYFSENNPASQAVAGMPSWFKLDDEHVGIYVS